VYETGNFINGAPAVIGNKAVFGGCDATVHVVNAETGEGIATINGGAYIAGSIAVADNKAYYGHYENAVMCIDLEKQSAVWSYADEQSAFFSTPAVTKDRVVIGGRDMQVHCLDRATGKQLWKFPTKGEVDSSPVVSQDKVVVGSGDGRLYILNLADGKEVWSYDTGGAIMGSPVVLEGRILIGDTGGYLYCFGDKPKTDEKTPKDK
jgi:outer membrane protein assembly factor BamB